MSTDKNERAGASSLAVITGAEIDQQIATARRFPMHSSSVEIANVMRRIEELATSSRDVADQCIYALPRGGELIEGPSVRFAEIVASCWGNVRAGARVIAEERGHIVAQGIFHDLETNVAISYEVKRRITTSSGARFNDDMIAVTGNAACGIAFRNAVFKGVPRAHWAQLLEKVRTVALGDVKDLASRRSAMLKTFQKWNIDEATILQFLGIKDVKTIDLETLAKLRGIAQAIRDGDVTPENAFRRAEPQAQPEQTSAPAETRVESGDGLVDDAGESKTKGKAKGKAKQGSAMRIVAEPAADPEEADDDATVEPDEGAAEEQAAGEDEEPKHRGPQEGESAVPVTDRTQVCLFDEEPVAVGALALSEDDSALQWGGKEWLILVDQQAGLQRIRTDLAKRCTDRAKRARLNRDQALQAAADTLGLQNPPKSFLQFEIPQLVELLSQD